MQLALGRCDVAVLLWGGVPGGVNDVQCELPYLATINGPVGCLMDES